MVASVVAAAFPFLHAVPERKEVTAPRSAKIAETCLCDALSRMIDLVSMELAVLSDFHAAADASVQDDSVFGGGCLSLAGTSSSIPLHRPAVDWFSKPLCKTTMSVGLWQAAWKNRPSCRVDWYTMSSLGFPRPCPRQPLLCKPFAVYRQSSKCVHVCPDVLQVSNLPSRFSCAVAIYACIMNACPLSIGPDAAKSIG